MYFPFGEVWREEGQDLDKDLLGFKFISKELDQETGYYYFGARYYDPKLSNWISPDPAIGKYIPKAGQLFFPEEPFKPADDLPGQGGIYFSININMYHYGGLNPIKFVDPDGQWTKGQRTLAISRARYYLAQGTSYRNNLAASNEWGTYSNKYGSKLNYDIGATLYKYGASRKWGDPEVDCSSLMLRVYGQYSGLGVTSRSQFKNTTKVNPAKVMEGDLAFWTIKTKKGKTIIGHVGIVTKVEKTDKGLMISYIHAASTSKGIREGRLFVDKKGKVRGSKSFAGFRADKRRDPVRVNRLRN